MNDPTSEQLVGMAGANIAVAVFDSIVPEPSEHFLPAGLTRIPDKSKAVQTSLSLGVQFLLALPL
jgi:hypothetical protein